MGAQLVFWSLMYETEKDVDRLAPLYLSTNHFQSPGVNLIGGDARQLMSVEFVSVLRFHVAYRRLDWPRTKRSKNPSWCSDKQSPLAKGPPTKAI